MKIVYYRLAYVWLIILATLATIVSFQMVGCSPASADELPIPVQTILAEAVGEGLEGMIAVGNVIRNRAEYRGQTVEQVCLAPKQFICWNKRGYVDNFIKKLDTSSIQLARDAWQVSGTEDVTRGADHYYASYIMKPSWARSMRHTVTIGRHQFYRAL